MNHENREALERRFNDLCVSMVAKQPVEVALQFDRARRVFDESWRQIYEEAKDNPNAAEEALEKLLLKNPEPMILVLAVARSDSLVGFQQVKRLIEHTLRASEGQSGYPAIYRLPHVLSGFMYMACAVLSLYWQSWEVFEKILKSKFEYYHQSPRPMFATGFLTPALFHHEAFKNRADLTHAKFRGWLGGGGFAETTGLRGEELLGKYNQAQMLMCFKAVQISDQGVGARLWADFGLAKDYYVIPVLDRIHADEEYAKGILAGFDEDGEEFEAKFPERLDRIKEGFWGPRSGFWQSIEFWEPRN